MLIKGEKTSSFPISKRAILVTGASSGIGFSICTYLAENGFTVFATVRKESDAERLKNLNLPELIPVYPLDLTDSSHIQLALKFASEEIRKRCIKGLYGIINNAGGGFIAPVELMDLKKFRLEIETRILGHLQLIQNFLPMIREAQGRIIWITAPALVPISFVSSIHACDFAVNCLVRTLRIELSPWNIPVIMIRCGGIKTPAVEKSYIELEEFLKNIPENSEGKIYKEILRKEIDELKEFDKRRTEPIEVAKVVFKALTAKNPKSKYQAGYMSRLSAFLELLPQSFVDFIMLKRIKAHY